MKDTKVYIDPNSRMLYASFYLKGLYEVYGKENVHFSTIYFKDLDRKSEAFSFEHYFPFVVITSTKKVVRVVIDFCDPPDISERAYNWCDCYAKINFNPTYTEKRFLNKLVCIPPSFGIRIWSFKETLSHIGENYIKCKGSLLVSFKRFLKDYYHQYKRPVLESYLNEEEVVNFNKPYVFMIASLWKDTNCLEGVNLQRKLFIEQCKKSNCNFEGGFFALEDHPQYKTFKDIVFTSPYDTVVYVKKTKQSAFVFNTPAVHNCHGWKLGEYLAMGKAIISTPLFNELPEELVHGKNVHFVSSTEELKVAIDLLLEDDIYRVKLEKGAKAYYKECLRPKKVIENIMKSVC